MNYTLRALRLIFTKPRVVAILLLDRISSMFSDRVYLKLMFRLKMGKWPNLDDPRTYNEKLQWLKLHDRRPEYTMMVDKVKVKKWVAEKIGIEHIIPTLAVWENADDIDFDILPNEFVIKCNHNSGGLYVCTNKAQMDTKKVREGLRKSLGVNYFLHGREWAYKNVPRCIFAEKYMVDESGYELKDYKLFCFNGEPQFMFIATDRGNPNEDTKFDFFDMEFNHLPFTNGHPNATQPVKCPSSFEKMKELARVLSAGIPHVRVDFYDINGQVYFGEMTFSHWSGMVPFEPREWDVKFGNLIDLSKVVSQ